MVQLDKYLLETPDDYIKNLPENRDYELREYQPPHDKVGRGNKIILKIIRKEDKDIIIYSYEDYE
ncbi:MAG TPA: hypothetical protein VJ907_04155 [Halanaerobiales bacterium]|nr:hypothetical protein [Halanaerobiales bacterium]